MDRDRERAERAWRLSLLLTGDREAAAVLAARAMQAQPKEVAIPDARLDRLVIMRFRESAIAAGAKNGGQRGPLGTVLERLRAQHRKRRLGERPNVVTSETQAPAPPLPAEAGEALLGARRTLTQSELEAWSLREVEGRGEIEAAQAMNCSRSATERAHEKANDKLENALGMAAEQAAKLIRRALDQSDADVVLRRHREIRRERFRGRLLRALVLLVVLLAIAGGAWALWRFGGIGEPSGGLPERGGDRTATDAAP